MKIAVSYLKSDNYKNCIEKINKTQCDFLHVDMCDGKYVEDKNFTIGQLVELLKISTKPLDVHMMVKDPSKYFNDLALLNIETITIHLDSCDNLLETINLLREMGLKVGLALNPDQDVELLKPYLSLIDEVLIMSVVPGKGGQTFMDSVLTKIDQINELKNNYHFITAIDGGINGNTIELIKDKNLDLIISGSYITQSDDFNQAINSLKNC